MGSSGRRKRRKKGQQRGIPIKRVAASGNASRSCGRGDSTGMTNGQRRRKEEEARKCLFCWGFFLLQWEGKKRVGITMVKRSAARSLLFFFSFFNTKTRDQDCS